MSLHESIIILGAGKALQFEAKAAEAGIYPGHIVEESAAGSFLRCNSAGTDALTLVAIENSINGKTKDDVYANGETVYARALVPGMIIQAKVAAAADAIVYGDKLELDGDGGVRKQTAIDQGPPVVEAGVVKFIAKEAVDNSAGGAAVFIMAQAI